jgi:hypothetical protein
MHPLSSRIIGTILLGGLLLLAGCKGMSRSPYMQQMDDAR